MASALERIVAETGMPELVDVLAARLSPTDLQTLMLAVYRQRSAARSPADVLADYERNRFFGASPLPASGFEHWSGVLQRSAPGFDFLVLSPMAPLAACAAVAPVGQDWSIPTARTGEVVSDPTNVLALEAALRRRHTPDPIHLATIQRVVRPQAYGGKGMLAHFTLAALVSSARDTGSYRTEAALLTAHLDALLGTFVHGLGTGARLSVSYTLRNAGEPDARRDALAAVTARHGVALWEDPDRAAADGYYAGLCFHVWRNGPTGRRQLADGGAVDWVARFTSNRKERTLISGFGLDGLIG